VKSRYLRANGFKTFIVSGGGIEFMPPWTERIYGVPPEQVIGSSIKTKFELRDGTSVLVRLPEINFKEKLVWKINFVPQSSWPLRGTVMANERSPLAFAHTSLECFLGGAGSFKFFGHPISEIV